ncbi:MAG: SDR family oxidoreductase [Acidobacteria bacterium]|nr:SDR family oxidoreductase [Acidobacteriota bacterium]
MAKTRTRTRAASDRRPKPPFPKQHQPKPGRESELEPRPKYEAPDYRASGKLNGNVAIVTGGDSGIGRAVAVLFAREGADVALVFLPEERDDAEETARAIEGAGRRALLIAGDLRRPAFCRRVIATTVRRWGRLDVLVNNAAFQQHQPSIAEISDAQWTRTFETNIFAMFWLTQAALPHLRPGAAIINTGSIVGLNGSGKLLDYASTKGAIHAFTKSLAQSLVDREIRVNCVAPGPVWTPLNPSDRPPDEVATFGQDTPMGRPGQPEEIAPAYVFFASNADSSYITGEVLTITGGKTVA